MEIVYGNNKIKKQCQSATRKLKKRLDDLRAADNLSVVKTLPGRCHALKGNRSGQWAIDLEQPKRLIFEPIGDPLPINEDGWLNTDDVKAICLLEVVDYHG